ncbi:DUF4442 domain-containing protein [Bailinhaonella thermotolerans]|uniref:DUF4442 domain-containing protein n=1 Tax=Bailinhaonella thermotolerans TaxID=1070861 RepID=A0A3A4AEM4_9ACTN|nr:DUF4442 domain-containing protein [Bailinhaonella thermotolerans]RJL25194.1 DUF4442 domain-containing protein [Bailinhaonella thermotolerans]
MTTIDPNDVKTLMLEGVPFARNLGIEYGDIGEGVVVARVADRPEIQNHVGGPHAGVLFTLAESASGAAMLSAVGDQLGRATPLPTTARIDFLKLARGDVECTATLRSSRAEILAELDAGRRPSFDVHIAIRRVSDGATVAEMTVTWILRPND